MEALRLESVEALPALKLSPDAPFTRFGADVATGPALNLRMSAGSTRLRFQVRRDALAIRDGKLYIRRGKALHQLGRLPNPADVEQLAAVGVDRVAAKAPASKGWKLGPFVPTMTPGLEAETVAAQVRGPWAVHKSIDGYTLSHVATGQAVQIGYTLAEAKAVADRFDRELPAFGQAPDVAAVMAVIAANRELVRSIREGAGNAA